MNKNLTLAYPFATDPVLSHPADLDADVNLLRMRRKFSLVGRHTGHR